jgi:hypothetical protein
MTALTGLVYRYTEVEHDDENLDKLLDSVDQRFIGSTKRSEFLAERETRMGNTAAAEAYYRQNIKAAPAYGKSYHALGRLLIESGKVNEAAKVVLSSPHYRKGADENPVGVSIEATEDGSLFYWSGHSELAKPLYEIAAGLGSGSASEMASVARLKLMAGDYQGAMEPILERAQRYHDSYSFRDFIGMLHAIGQSKDAWGASTMPSIP